jgi:hypothetical protein
MVQLELFKVLAGNSARKMAKGRRGLSVEITGEGGLDMVGGVLRLLAIQIIQGPYNRNVVFSIAIL